jgi:hypothetical protein
MTSWAVDIKMLEQQQMLSTYLLLQLLPKTLVVMVTVQQ